MCKYRGVQIVNQNLNLLCRKSTNDLDKFIVLNLYISRQSVSHLSVSRVVKHLSFIHQSQICTFLRLTFNKQFNM